VIDVTLFSSAARTASTNGSEAVLGFGNGRVLVCYLDVTAVSGTSPTLDVKIQESDDGSTWTDIDGGSFSQFTSTGQEYKVMLMSRSKDRIRAVATIGGTSPSFTFKVEAVAIG